MNDYLAIIHWDKSETRESWYFQARDIVGAARNAARAEAIGGQVVSIECTMFREG